MAKNGKKFGELLRKYRTQVPRKKEGGGKGLSQEKLAEEISLRLKKMGLDQEYSGGAIGHWEQGRYFPQTREVVLAIIWVLSSHGSLTTKDEADELLIASNNSPLTRTEMSVYLFDSNKKFTQTHHKPTDLIPSLVLGTTIDGVMDVLRREYTWGQSLPYETTRMALKAALGNALNQFATGERLSLLRSLMQRDGFLTNSQVHAEFAKTINVGTSPNYELLGQLWRDFASDASPALELREEAKRLFTYFRNELSLTQELGSVIKIVTLDSIRESTGTTANSLSMIEARLGSLLSLVETQFVSPGLKVAEAPSAIRREIRDFSLYIQDKTQRFVGREFVTEAIEAFTRRAPRGYFWIRGDPGLGKTAIAANLVKTNKYIHHFNIRADGINKTSDFLRNICAQLIAFYNLPYDTLPARAGQDAGTLNELLLKVSQQLKEEEKCFIVVDALDEAEGVEVGVSNPLLLPISLPSKIYMILTSQRVNFNLRFECEFQIFDIEQNNKHNIEDIETYIISFLQDDGIETYIQQQALEPSQFTAIMVQKSQGNFMYLRYVLPEIAEGHYQDQALATLPEGLENYYQVQWNLIKGRNLTEWFTYKLHVLIALTVVREAVSINLLITFSKVQGYYVRAVIQEWRRFLYEEPIEVEGVLEWRYRLYHNSFFDFIASRQEIQEERVNLPDMHGQIAEVLLETYRSMRSRRTSH